MFSRICLFIVLELTLNPLFLTAQSSRGTITGNVHDPSGAAVAGAKVTVTDVDTGVKSTFQTDVTGNYFVTSLLPGHYSVEAGKSGFKTTTVGDLILDVAQTLRVDIPMEIGQLVQSMQVSASAQMVDTETTTIGQVVESQQVVDLPLNGRDFTNLLKLDVGVNSTFGGNADSPSVRPHGFNDSYTMVSVNGARPASISYLVDGVTANEPLFQTPDAIPPIDAIDEFRVQNGLYSAEFGQGSAQVNIAMKSGTNTVHGALWEFLRNAALEPENPVNHTRPPFIQNQFGGTFGGPIYVPKLYNGKDRTFFFFSYQGGRRETSSFQETQVPTAQEKTGNFSDWPSQLFNPLTGVANPSGTPPVTRSPFAGNQIPAALIAPQSQKLLQYYPAPNVNCAMPCENYIGNVTSPVNMNNFTVRVDQNFSSKDRLTGQFLFQNLSAPQNSLIPLSGITEQENSRNAGLQWTHIFSPRTLNEARFGYNRFVFVQGYQTAGNGVNYAQQIGFTGLDPDTAYNALPAISMGTQYGTLGYSGTAPFNNISNVFQYMDDLVLTRGRHSVKFGADIRRDQNYNRTGLGGNGQLNFSGEYTAFNPTAAQVAGSSNAGNAFADFLLGYASGSYVDRFSAFDTNVSTLRNTDVNLYVQDQFKVNAQLTLDLGLRWELHTPYHDKYDGGDVLDFNYPGGRLLYANQAFTQLVNNPIQAACCAPQSLIPVDYHDFAPRVGFAWRPISSSNKFVVRGGYGIFYDVLDNYYPTQAVTKDIPYLEPTLPTPSGLESTPPIDIRNMFPAPYSVAARSFPPPYCQAPSSSVINSAGVMTAVLNQCTNPRVEFPGNRTPYNQQWGLDLQYQLRPTVLLDLGYQGSHGLREPIAWSFNQAFLPPVAGNANNSVSYVSQCPAGTYPSACDPVQARVPYYNFAAGGTALANIAPSYYEALTLKVEKRFSHGLQSLSSFTWGKTIDESSELGGGLSGDTDRAQWGQNLYADMGLADFSQAYRFVESWVYQLPFGDGKHFLNQNGVAGAILGGWQANGIVTLVSGTPFTILCGCGDRSQTGETRGTERLNMVGPLYSGFNQTMSEYFNTAAFAEPALGTLGNEGRDVGFSTPQHAVDFSLFKNAKLRENLTLQIRGEAFNLFSSHYYTPVFPNNSFTATNFGSLVPPGGNSGNLWNPRTYQFALKLLF